MKRFTCVIYSVLVGFLLAYFSREGGLFITIPVWLGLIPIALVINIAWYLFLKYIMKVNMKTFKYSSKWSDFNTCIATIYATGFCTLCFRDPHPSEYMPLVLFFILLIVLSLIKKNYRLSLFLLLMVILNYAAAMMMLS